MLLCCFSPISDSLNMGAKIQGSYFIPLKTWGGAGWIIVDACVEETLAYYLETI